MRNRILTAVALVCGMVGLVSARAAELIHADRVLAIVNDTVITQFDVQNELIGIARSMRSRQQLKDLREHAERLATDILDRLIREELVYAEFKEKGFMIPPELLQERLDAIITREAGGDREAFETMLEEAPITMEELREQIRRRVAVELMMQQHVGREAHVSPGEIKRYYEDNSDDFRRPATCLVCMLVLPVPDKSREEQEAVARHVHKQSLVQKLREKTGDDAPLKTLAENLGASFSVETYLMEDSAESTDGTREAYPLRPELRSTVQSLEEGERAEPFVLEDQVILLELVARTPGGIQPLSEDLRSAIRARLRARKQQDRMDEFVDELKEKHFVKRMD